MRGRLDGAELAGKARIPHTRGDTSQVGTAGKVRSMQAGQEQAAARDAPQGAAPRESLTERLLLLHPVVVLFALLSFEWFTVVKAGGFAVRLPYLAVLAGLVLAGFVPRVVMAGVGLSVRWAPFVLPYALYIMILYLVLQASEARGIAVRQIFFFGSFLIIGGWVAAAQDLRRLLRWAGAACLIAFFVGTEVIARDIGSSWAEAVVRFTTQGDLDFVFYDFFRGIFNVHVADSGDLVKASQKNAVAVAVLIGLMTFRAAGATDRRDVIGVVITLLVMFVLLMLNSRSVLLVAVFGLGLVGGLHVLRDWRPSPAWAFGVIFLLLIAAAGVTALFYTHNAAIDALGARLAFEDDSATSRLQQYSWALNRIEDHILWGSGYAEIDGQPVHNLMLGALMHAGLPAFALVTIAYVSLVAFWLGFLRRIVREPEWWVLPLRPEWIAALPISPLVRVWLSGDAGHPGLQEWIALAVFLGVLQANAMRRAESPGSDP